MPTHSLGLLGATEREGRMKRKGGIEKERKRGSPSLWPLPLPWLLKLRGPLALDFCAPAPSPLPLLPLSLSRILPPVLAPDNLLKQVNSLPLRRFESFLAPALVFFLLVCAFRSLLCAVARAFGVAPRTLPGDCLTPTVEWPLFMWEVRHFSRNPVGGFSNLDVCDGTHRLYLQFC